MIFMVGSWQLSAENYLMLYFGSWLIAPALAVVLCGMLYRLFVYQWPVYRYTIVTILRGAVNPLSAAIFKILTFIRVITLILLLIVCGQPRQADTHTKLPVQGIDIMLVLDFSGSMETIDDPRSQKTRVDVAKEQAVAFIKRRSDDAIGLTVFGENALTRCPLTHDHTSLIKILDDIKIGNTVIPQGTVISIALVSALNRLKNTQSPSKIIVLLTDGSPTPRRDISAEIPLELARKLGVKIYTIGVGSETVAMIPTMLNATPLNTDFLKYLAENTGGKFFLASNEKELERIYNTIDSLEKRNMNIESYTRYVDRSLPCAITLLILLALEFILRWLKRVLA